MQKHHGDVSGSKAGGSESSQGSGAFLDVLVAVGEIVDGLCATSVTILFHLLRSALIVICNDVSVQTDLCDFIVRRTLKSVSAKHSYSV